MQRRACSESRSNIFNRSLTQYTIAKERRPTIHYFRE